MLRSTLILIASVACAQNATLTPRWNAGDEFTLEMVRTRENSQRPQMNGSATTLVTLKVLETGEKQSIVQWTYGESTYSNPDIARNPLLVKMSDALQGYRLDLILSEDGNFAGLQNESEVTQKLERALEVLAQEFRGSPQVVSVLRQVMNPKVLIVAAARDAQIYFMLGGLVLQRDFRTESPLTVASPLGGNASAVVRISVTGLDDREVSAKITSSYDPASVKAMTEALLKQLAASIPNEQLAGLPPLQMTDETVATASLALGLPLRVETTRRVSMGSAMSRLDRWSFRLVNWPGK